MTRVVAAVTTAPAEWDETVVEAPGGHVLQSAAWAEHRATQGWQPHFLTFDDDRCALVLTRRQRPVPGSAAYSPRGPVSAGDPPDAVAGRAIGLAQWARAARVRVLTVDPELDASSAYDDRLAEAGFTQREEIQASRHRLLVPMPPGTTEESLLAAMSKSARQRIRAAEASGTTIEEDAGGERLADLARMLGDAGAAKQFSIGNVTPLMAWWRRVLVAGHARFWVARHNGETAGALLAYVQGGHMATAYSADDRARRSELPGTMHLLRWNYLRTALARGDAIADLGGVDVAGARRIPNPTDRTYGLYEHKRSLGAVWTESAAAHEIVLRPFWHAVAGLGSRIARG